MFKKYEVIVKPIDVTEPGNLQFLSRIEPDGYSSDYIDTDENGNEVYEVKIDEGLSDWMESQLDQTDGVVSYYCPLDGTVWVKEEQ